MTAHTPGPWHVIAVDSKRGRIVGDETATETWDKLRIQSSSVCVATVYRPRDARLIAAAPELLRAFRVVFDCWSNGIPLSDDAAEGMRALIAKAEGCDA